MVDKLAVEAKMSGEEAFEYLEDYLNTMTDGMARGSGVTSAAIMELTRRVGVAKEKAGFGDAAGDAYAVGGDGTVTRLDGEPAADEDPNKGLSRMTKPELIERARERGIETNDDMTVADLRELLSAE